MQNETTNVLSQAERSFFTLRYAVPGLTVILFSVLVSYPTLRGILIVEANITLVGAFLAFFSLLGGSAVGFLVSQSWYIFDYCFLYGNYGKLRKLREDLQKEYKEYDLHDRFDQVLFLNELFGLSDERTQYYAQRRYDLYHTCGSTLFATIAGYFLGIVIRTRIFKVYAFVNYDMLVFLIFVFVSITLGLSLRNAAREHARITDKVVRETMRVHQTP